MRINKYSIYLTSIVSIFSLFIAIVLNEKQQDFVANLFAGICTGAILTLMISVLGYQLERKKTLERFYSYARKAAFNYNLFENEGDLERTIDLVLQMNDFDYLELDNAYGDISFLWKDEEKRTYIYDTIYGVTIHMRDLIAKKAFHFKQYRKQTSRDGDSRKCEAAMHRFVNEIDAEIMLRMVKTYTDEDGEERTVWYSKNRVSPALLRELNGKYFEIMYPIWAKTKKEASYAD